MQNYIKFKVNEIMKLKGYEFCGMINHFMYIFLEAGRRIYEVQGEHEECLNNACNRKQWHLQQQTHSEITRTGSLQRRQLEPPKYSLLVGSIHFQLPILLMQRTTKALLKCPSSGDSTA
jgi:hypothetical protein